MVAIPDFDFFRKVKASAGESKKAAALRRELAETSNMLLWLLRRIDEYNDNNERSFCPEPDTKCHGNCRGCWISAALDYARRYAHG